MSLLVEVRSACVIHPGDALLTSRGEKVRLVKWEDPQHAGSTGRVYVKNAFNQVTGYFPSVVGCAIKGHAFETAQTLPPVVVTPKPAPVVVAAHSVSHTKRIRRTRTG